MAEEKQHIRLHVYDTDMSAYIMREEEKLYRDAAKLITDKINNYAGRFKGRKSEKELLYMALIDIALNYERELSRNDKARFNDILGKLTSEIEDALGSDKENKQLK